MNSRYKKYEIGGIRERIIDIVKLLTVNQFWFLMIPVPGNQYWLIIQSEHHAQFERVIRSWDTALGQALSSPDDYEL